MTDYSDRFGTLEDRAKAKEKREAEIQDYIANNPEKGNYLRMLPAKYQKLVYDSYNSDSKARALKAKCLDCCAYQKEEVRNCPVKICPLWEHRPYK